MTCGATPRRQDAPAEGCTSMNEWPNEGMTGDSHDRGVPAAHLRAAGPDRRRSSAYAVRFLDLVLLGVACGIIAYGPSVMSSMLFRLLALTAVLVYALRGVRSRARAYDEQVGGERDYSSYLEELS